KTAGNQAGSQNGKTVVANTDAAVAQVGVAQQLLNPLLAGLLVAGDARSTTEGQAKAVENASATGSEKMAPTAPDNVTKLTPVATGKDSGPQDNHKAQAQAFANAANQAKAVAADQSAVNVEIETATGVKPIETQAASLAKVFGDGNKAQVSVTVTNEAQILTSKPTASLTSGAVLANDGASQSSGQNANANAQATAHNPVVAAQTQQAQGGPAQSQGAQNSQGLNTAQAQTDAKGLVQAANASGNSGGTAHSGGGEAGAQANAGNVSAGQQAQQAQQQAQADKAHNAEKPSRPGHSVVEQVFVKITKAINAGNDKITIQLRPANLGRVEVKMELTHDNRLMAVVTADNKDTLEALQRDAKELQKALHDAGLHTGNGDLNFNLRGQTGQGTDGDGKTAGKLFGDDVAGADEAAMETAMLAPRDGIYVNGRIDVRA
ncbi:MAG: flagellar hook-length control protein FliK, partial [Rhodospirillales bacterium]|nr:flagellar hook-length control protein FliK [Rhodospirillales bacterium]